MCVGVEGAAFLAKKDKNMNILSYGITYFLKYFFKTSPELDKKLTSLKMHRQTQKHLINYTGYHLPCCNDNQNRKAFNLLVNLCSLQHKEAGKIIMEGNEGKLTFFGAPKYFHSIVTS